MKKMQLSLDKTSLQEAPENGLFEYYLKKSSNPESILIKSEIPDRAKSKELEKN